MVFLSLNNSSRFRKIVLNYKSLDNTEKPLDEQKESEDNEPISESNEIIDEIATEEK